MADETKNVESVPTHSNDPLLSGEDRLKLTKLMNLCTNLQKKVLDLEKTKTAQDSEIASLKKRVKKLERRNKSRTPWLKILRKVGSARRLQSSDEASLGDQEDASKQGRKIADIDANAEGVVEKEVSAADPVTTVGEVVTTASVELSTTKPSEFTTTPATSKPSQDKGKAKMTEPEKPLKKKDQIMYDQEVALNLQAQLQAKLEEEERLARQKEEDANIALIESWDNTQVMMDADRLLAERLQAREQEELIDEEKARLIVELLEKRQKHFAALRAQEKRNKPPTKAQKKSTMSTYLKHMAGYNKKRAKDSTKRTGTKLEQEVAKKQKIDDDQEVAKLKELMKVISDEKGVAIDDIPLSTKPLCIVPEEGYERVLWGDLKTMFEHHVEDIVWRLLMKKLNDFEDKYQVLGRIGFGIKRHHDDLRVTAAQLVLLVQSYNCSRIKTAEKNRLNGDQEYLRNKY
ncbi:hypothetical protein Tco_0452451 [Tanacetum coccineum]